MPQAGVQVEVKTIRLWIGIDPGASGGIAVLGNQSQDVVTEKMPPTERDLWETISALRATYRLDAATAVKPVAVIEKVGGYIGGVGHPGSAMFKFGQSFGTLKMALCAAGIPYDEVPPAVWQRAVGVTPRRKAGKGKAGESKTQFKNRLKARAQQLYPQAHVTLDVADALLLAHYCRMKDEGKI